MVLQGTNKKGEEGDSVYQWYSVRTTYVCGFVMQGTFLKLLYC